MSEIFAYLRKNSVDNEELYMITAAGVEHEVSAVAQRVPSSFTSSHDMLHVERNRESPRLDTPHARWSSLFTIDCVVAADSHRCEA